ncbi:MAG: efflux RND transporter periplasmic adaptor subunit [Rhodocyclaceae bacterium]|jgi:membrane fusion protein (multidrug efflux system)|nr:Multidrug resistance protein MexA [Rhodocyclaceae bacterium]MCC6879317.1 efflux RND transporter periplasmic adaptor subunit [Rhodocyclaceae bacterium]MCL4680732.1 efflux RND transporter periplasmic adaptor subunit [Rhodocyclaceae bacterium]
MATRKILAASCIVFTTALLGACGPGEQKPGGGAPGPGGAAPPPPEVEVITVAAASATVTRELPGRLQAVRTAQVRARVEGIVERRLFAEGSDVKAGTPLFRLDARTYRTTATAAEADLVAARQTHERNRRLLEQKMVSLQQYELGEARLKQAEAALARARLDVENASVLAPISGRIGRALVTEGALVGKGESTHLATIEQLDPIYANFTQSNADLLRLQQALKAGKLKRAESAKVELLLEDGSVYPLPGKLLFADLAVDPNTGSVQMRAEFPNPQRELLPGTFVRIRFPEAEMEQAIRVPQRAVQMSAQGQSVMLVDAEGKAAPRPVKVGAMAGSDWIVVDGLKGGEQIIVNGLQKARPGTPVKAVPAGAAPASAPGTPAASPAPAAGK